MKEGAPGVHFRHQEERRLYSFALPRAQDRLTITWVSEKKGKVPPFIEDILMEPSVKRRDVLQLAPKITTAPIGSPNKSDARTAQNLLFAPSFGETNVFSRCSMLAPHFTH